MVAKLRELRALENQAAIFANQFWRDFYKALSEGVSQRAITRVSALLLAASLFLPIHARATDTLNLVIALDLTKSVAGGQPGQRQEFEKNVAATAQILARVPADTHITLIGITAQSFGEPLILLEAYLPADEGYFQERIIAARRSLVQA